MASLPGSRGVQETIQGQSRCELGRPTGHDREERWALIILYFVWNLTVERTRKIHVARYGCVCASCFAISTESHKNVITEMLRRTKRKKPGTARRKQELLSRILLWNLKSKYVLCYIHSEYF